MAAEPPSNLHAVPSRGTILEFLRPQGAFWAISGQFGLVSVLTPLSKVFAA